MSSSGAQACIVPWQKGPGLIHTQQSSGYPAEESRALVKAGVVCGSRLPSPEGHGVGDLKEEVRMSP